MRRTIWAGASLMVLAACGNNPEAVGENSPDSIKTTAMGNVVAAIPSPTPTPTSDTLPPTNEMTTNAVDSLSDNVM